MKRILLILIFLPIVLFSQSEQIKSIVFSHLNKNGKWQFTEKYIYNRQPEKEEELRYAWKNNEWRLTRRKVREHLVESNTVTHKRQTWNNGKWELVQLSTASVIHEDKEYITYEIIEEPNHKGYPPRTRKIKKGSPHKVLEIEPTFYASTILNRVAASLKEGKRLTKLRLVGGCGFSDLSPLNLYYDLFGRLKFFKKKTSKGVIKYLPMKEEKTADVLKKEEIYKVYPNPLVDRLTIEKIKEGLMKVKVIDVKSTIVFEDILDGIYENVIDLSFLTAGNYMLILEMEEQMYTEKLLKLQP